MAYILMTLFSVLFATATVAQPKQTKIYLPDPRLDADKFEVLDTAYLRVSYALNADDLADLSTYIDLQYLEIGERFSKYYSAFISNCDSLCTEWLKQHPQAQSRPSVMGEMGKKLYWSEYQSSEIFRYGGRQTVYARMPGYLKRFDSWYAEPYPLPRWEIGNDTLTVCGYLCQNATCSFRGRDFTAWFAPEIPVAQGPWTFGGLPGLILKVYDAEKLYTFECVSIAQGAFPIKKLDYSSYRQENRTRILELQRKINENYYQVAQIRDLKTGKLRSRFTPYKPLELE